MKIIDIMFSRFKLKRSIRQAIALNSSTPICETLAEFPNRVGDALSRVTALVAKRDYPHANKGWHGLLVCLGVCGAHLAGAVHSPEAMVILRTINMQKIDRCWWDFQRLASLQTVLSLVYYVRSQGEATDLEQVCALLTSDQSCDVINHVVGEAKIDYKLIYEMIRPKLSMTSVLSLDRLTLPGVRAVISAIEAHGESDDLSRMFQLFGMEQQVHIINAFRKSPSVAYLPLLKRVWWDKDPMIRQNFSDQNPDALDPRVIAIADAVTMALGACAALRTGYHDFNTERNAIPQLEQKEHELKQAIAEHNDMIGQITALFQAGKPTEAKRVGQEAIRKKAEIARLEKELDALHKKHRESLSEGYILLLVLNKPFAYPIAVRQGAAYGLYLLLKTGEFDPATSLEIFSSLSAQLSSPDKFGERHIHLTTHATVDELTERLEDGLRWMLDIMEGLYIYAHFDDGDTEQLLAASEVASTDNGYHQKMQEGLDAFLNARDSLGTSGLAEYSDLDTTVRLMRELMPKLLPFLQECPLRLMRMEDHKQAFGVYAARGCEIEQWTQFVPPKRDENVTSRYLKLNNRSRPNAIGIYYPLFRNPLLVLPVIYHEYLHYGGLNGNPKDSIWNETEVLIREILFMRSLMNRLAPQHPGNVRDFESEILKQIRVTNFLGLCSQMFVPLDRSSTLLELNQEIISAYGGLLSNEEAVEKANRDIDRENLSILLANALQTVRPDKEWPLLSETGDTQDLTQSYKEILVEHYQRDQRLTEDRLREILNEDLSRRRSQDWQEYCNRPGALNVLSNGCNTQNYSIGYLLFRLFASLD